MNDTSHIINVEANKSSEDETSLRLDCPSLDEADKEFLSFISYWIGGVTAVSITVSELIINLAAIFVLSKRSVWKKNFDQLVVALCVFDFLFLALYLTEVLRNYFGVHAKVLYTFFPKFLYPIREISFTASIFTTVAIARERYGIVINPLFNQRSIKATRFHQYSQQHAKLKLKYRFHKYLFTVIFCAVMFNIPRFFETQILWKNINAKQKEIINRQETG